MDKVGGLHARQHPETQVTEPAWMLPQVGFYAGEDFDGWHASSTLADGFGHVASLVTDM